MQAAAEAQFVVDTIVEANRRGHDASLRAAGALLPPQAHLLAESYLGFVTCRPFYRGGDVTRALRGLGVAASLVGASRLVLAWEHQDLCTALEKPGAGDEPCGQVAVDVHRHGGHVLRWHPFRLHAGPADPQGWPTAVPTWGAPALHRDAVLPLAVWELLRVWREPVQWDAVSRAELLAQLEAHGYHLCWMSRHVGPAASRPA